jgi:hypothetical protein
MSKNNRSQTASKDELCEKLRDLVTEKRQVQEQIKETERQIGQTQYSAKQTG